MKKTDLRLASKRAYILMGEESWRRPQFPIGLSTGLRLMTFTHGNGKSFPECLPVCNL